MSEPIAIPGFEHLVERERVLEYFREHHADYLRGAREFAKDLARRRGCVAVDDVRIELQRHGYPMPEELEIDGRVLGALFRSKEFVAIKQRPTHRQARIARSGRGASFVTVYALRPGEDGNAA
jgi:hypothetical protein